MRILFLTTNLSEGYGIVNYNKNLLKVLADAGVKLSVIELRKSTVFYKIIFSLASFFNGIVLRPDVIFCAHINFSPLVYFLKKISGRKYVVFTHGTDAWNIKNNYQKLALREAKAVISVSRYTAGKIGKQIPRIKNKIFLLPNAVDGTVFFPKNKSDGLVLKHGLLGKKVILTISRLSLREGYKGYDKIIQALPAIIKEVPDVVYILAGSGDDIGRVRSMVKRLDLEDNVILPGFIPDEDMVDYYNLCDVFVMPSKGEGFGIVFLEALACGKPVIAGNRDGSRDALLDGELGILIDPDSVEEIKKAIVNVLKREIPDDLLNETLLRKRVLNAYGFDKFREKLNNFINTIYEKKDSERI